MKNKAQSTIEYAVLIAIVCLAVVAMGVYVRRSANANLKMTETRINEIDWKFPLSDDGDDGDDHCKNQGRPCTSDDECCSDQCVSGFCGHEK